MSNDNVLELKKPGVSSAVRDALTEVLRDGARSLLAQAVAAEVTEFLVRYQGEQDAVGRARMVRNGHLPERTIQTGLGQVAVKAPRVHDRSGQVRFNSSIVPRYLRRSRSIEELLPWLYLKGISSGEFSEALAALLGADAPGLSAGTISLSFPRTRLALQIGRYPRITQLIVRNGDAVRRVPRPRPPCPGLANALSAGSVRPSTRKGACASRGSNRDIGQ